jgi:hypothetical protein
MEISSLEITIIVISIILITFYSLMFIINYKYYPLHLGLAKNIMERRNWIYMMMLSDIENLTVIFQTYRNTVTSTAFYLSSSATISFYALKLAIGEMSSKTRNNLILAQYSIISVIFIFGLFNFILSIRSYLHLNYVTTLKDVSQHMKNIKSLRKPSNKNKIIDFIKKIKTINPMNLKIFNEKKVFISKNFY